MTEENNCCCVEDGKRQKRVHEDLGGTSTCRTQRRHVQNPEMQRGGEARGMLKTRRTEDVVSHVALGEERKAWGLIQSFQILANEIIGKKKKRKHNFSTLKW